jgi:predicted Zn finger-like uncharacterized protein
MFKVVTDQLKVSQGWVRCGHCAEVFDASKHLLSPETLAESSSLVDAPGADVNSSPPGEAALPAAANAAAVPGETNQALTAAEAAPAALADAVDSAADFDPAGWKEALQKRQLQEDGSVSAFLALGQGKTLTRTQPDFVGLAEEAPLGDEPPRRPDLVRKATVSEAEFEEELDALQQPTAETEKDVSFVRDAVRKAFWVRQSVRGMLLGFSLVLALLLGLQWVLQQKNSLAASAPRFDAAMRALCGALGCQIQPPRHVDSLIIDSSTFNKIAVDAYRLSFVLKNTGNLPVEMPALELTLTDTQDQAVVRRVLLPAEFGVDSGLLASREEVTGVVSLRVSGDGLGNAAASSNASASPASAANSLRVAGYRVLAFYP